jgi:hypothetical protein
MKVDPSIPTCLREREREREMGTERVIPDKVFLLFRKLSLFILGGETGYPLAVN